MQESLALLIVKYLQDSQANSKALDSTLDFQSG